LRRSHQGHASAPDGQVSDPGLHLLPPAGRLGGSHRGEGKGTETRHSRRPLPLRRQRQGDRARRGPGDGQSDLQQEDRRAHRRAHGRGRGHRADPGLCGRDESRNHRGRADAHDLPASDHLGDDEGGGAGCVRACAEYVGLTMTKEELANRIGKLIEAQPLVKRALIGRLPEYLEKFSATEKERLRTVDPVSEYAIWYDNARRLVTVLASDRLHEFEGLYLAEAKRSKFTLDSYTIRDFIQGIHVTGYTTDNIVVIFGAKFDLQLAILIAVRSRLDDKYADLVASLRFEFEKKEIEAASELLKAGHMRAAGALAGVALEEHLRAVCSDRGVELPKRATLSPLNDALKDAGIIDQLIWRRIQYLSDVRNRCAHQTGIEPSSEDVAQLVRETREMIAKVG